MTRYPRGLARLLRSVRNRLRAGRLAEQIDDELRFHLDMRIAEYVTAGMTPRDARAKALARFGPVDAVADACRAAHRLPPTSGSGVTTMLTVLQDLRFAARSLRKRPAFTLLALATLGLGIGGNTAIFSAVHSVILDPLPFPGGDRLAYVWMARDDDQVMISPRPDDVRQWRHATTVEALAPFDTDAMVLTGAGDPRPVTAGRLPPEMFDLLSIVPVRGRRFVAGDLPEDRQVVLLSERMWRQEFGGEDDALGTTLELDDTTYEVVGVLPRAVNKLFGGGAVDLFLPLADRHMQNGVNVLLRLVNPGSDSVVAAELAALRLRRPDLSAEDKEWTPTVQFPSRFISTNLRTGLWVLFGAVGFVFLIACVNVASMLLARGIGRQREIAVRSAIGAGRWRVTRQLLTEHLLLGVLGAAVGVGLAYLSLDVLRAMVPAGLDELRDVHVERSALVFTAALGIVAGLVFGVGPLLQLRGLDLTVALKQGGRAGEGGRSSRLRQGLVALEVAIALILFLGAGLMVRTLSNLANQDPGFQPDRLATVRITLPQSRYETAAARRAYYEAVLNRVQQLPDVRGVALGLIAPPQFGAMLGRLEIDGMPMDEMREAAFISANWVTPTFFSVAGIPLLRGSPVPPAGGDGDYVVASEGFARAYWPDGEALGQRLRFGRDRNWSTIIGIAANVGMLNDRSLNDNLQLYEINPEYSARGATLTVRVGGDAEQALALIKGQLWSVDPGLAVQRAVTVEQLLDDSIARPRFHASLLSAFAIMALVLAAVGVYGVIALNAQQRFREIGVRIALGARGEDVVRLMLLHGIRPVMIGVVVGAAGSFGLTRFLESLLFDVEPTDPLTFVVAALVLVVTGVVASYLPARRANRVDPVVALRVE